MAEASLSSWRRRSGHSAASTLCTFIKCPLLLCALLRNAPIKHFCKHRPPEGAGGDKLSSSHQYYKPKSTPQNSGGDQIGLPHSAERTAASDTD